MASTRSISFNNKKSREFGRTVKKRVDDYFKRNNLSKHANAAMHLKTFILLTLYFGSFALIMFGGLSVYAMWGLCFLMGIGMAGIGFSVSHDALHGAYSSNKTVNSVLGTTFDLLGANGYIWQITHNIIHHTYTNVHGHDEDLEVAEFIRLSPHQEYKPVHRYQHVLAFIAYSTATLFWVFIKDYKYFLQSELGPYKDKSHPIGEWIKLFVTKAIYYTYTIFLPLWLLDITFWQWLGGFITLHLTAGLILGIIFQLAHVVEDTEHVEPDEDNTIDEHWIIHEMETTNNFARDNKWLSWYIGGLNYQIEHHLFPKVSHVHYPEISKIVERTAREYDIPYNENETLFGAIHSHYEVLKWLGNPKSAPAPA